MGAGKVIKAWDVAVATMRVGEHAVVVCAPAYAYGDAGAPPDIPPGATLTFDVELVAVKPPRASGKTADAAAELARLQLEREARATAAAAEKKSSAERRAEAAAAAAARLAAKGQKKGGRK